MPQTYTPIASTTLTTAAASYTFSSIPTTYTDLVLVINSAIVTTGYTIRMQVGNSSVDTGTNYSTTALYGTGTAAGSNRESNQTNASINWNGYPTTTSGASITIVNLLNYSNTSTNKIFLTRANNAATGTDAIVSLWRSTSAINVIKIFPISDNFAAGTTLTLYGILKA